MPYANKFPRRRRRNYRKRMPRTNKNIAYKAYSMAKRLTRQIENKKDDYTGFDAPTTSGTVTHMTALAQGDAVNQRTGNSVVLRTLHYFGYIVRNSTDTENSRVVRLSIVQDLQQVGDSTPSFTAIYEASNVLANLNEDTVGRFKVLYSRTFTLSADKPVVLFKFYRKCFIPVRFNGANGTDIQKNGIYAISVSNTSTAGNIPTVHYKFRSMFQDS